MCGEKDDMMLTYEEAYRVYEWYCTVAEGDHKAKKILRSIGLISIHESGIVLCVREPNTSFLKVVDKKAFLLTKIKYGI